MHKTLNTPGYFERPDLSIKKEVEEPTIKDEQDIFSSTDAENPEEVENRLGLQTIKFEFVEVQDEFNDNLLYENTLERSNNPQGEDCKKCLDKNKLFSIVNVKLEDQKHLCLVEEHVTKLARSNHSVQVEPVLLRLPKTVLKPCLGFTPPDDSKLRVLQDVVTQLEKTRRGQQFAKYDQRIFLKDCKVVLDHLEEINPVQWLGFSFPDDTKCKALQAIVAELEQNTEVTLPKENSPTKTKINKRNKLHVLSANKITEAILKKGENVKLLCNCLKHLLANRRFKVTLENLRNVKHRRNCRLLNPNTVCKICAETFSTTWSLKRHMVTHSQTHYHCDKCDFKSVQKCNLERHVIIHMEQYPCKCEKCEFASVQSGSLKRHICSRHSRLRQFMCNDCNYCCVRKDMLSNHIKLKHNTDQ